MAEVKNAFIKSKMNLDLDARLVPNGEYRQGFNIQVSKSEGDDVGALENVLGNKLLENFDTLAGVSGLTIIGSHVSEIDNLIFLFLTNYTDPSPNPAANPTYNPTGQNYIYSYNTQTEFAYQLVSGSFLNFSTTNPIYGVNLLEDILFFTDNRNQPRKLNITLASNDSNYYTNEDQISIAKFAPYDPIRLYKNSTTAGLSGYETTMYDVVSPALPNTTTANPYLQNSNGNPAYAGDANFLEDKFIRFSYRYRFDDNEYSVFAPFTQAAFIPKQDGYFLTTGAAGTTTDEDATYRSTVVDFMENKVNKILLQIPLPVAGNQLSTNFHIKEIEILYKEDSAIPVYALDTITNFGTASTLEYTYQGGKPYKTLPESELVRVFDKVPVKALAQEVSGNRIIYGNFQDKHTPPSAIDYNVNASKKLSFNISSANTPAGTTAITEYPASTLKQNRNYQVGVVLSDKYGRSSTVILSNNISQASQNADGTNLNFDASTIYHNYRTSSDATNLPAGTWPGDSLKVLFNTQLDGAGFDKNGSTGTPGLYNGTSSSANYNPLGWYSYKIVVKQTEQEYYNVYLPGILNGPPNGITTDDTVNEVGFITLINDNVNKVPRDLSEVGPEQKQFRSSVELFGRVSPDYVLNTNPSYNTQFYPETSQSLPLPNTVITIAEEDDLFGIAAGASIPNIYDTLSNPLIGRISQINSNAIGASGSATTPYNFKLSVFETSPVESLLQIYYETSTTGLISELNQAILTGNPNEATGLSSFTSNFTEAKGNGDTIVSQFGVLTAAGGDTPQPVNLTLISVINEEGTNVTSQFELVPDPGSSTTLYDLKVASGAYFAYLADGPKVYTFTFKDLSGSGGSPTATLTLGNVTPSFVFTSGGSAPTTISESVGTKIINANNSIFSAVNGSADTSTADGNSVPINKRELVYSLVSNAHPDIFTIDPVSGQINVSNNSDPTGSYSLTIQVQDPGPSSNNKTSFTVNLVFGQAVVNPGFGANLFFNANNYLDSPGGSSLALYWTSNANNAVSTGPASGSGSNYFDRTIGGAQGSDSNTLVLPTTLADASNSYTTQATTFRNSSNGAVNYKNTNYNVLGTSNQSDGGLTAGTGYLYFDVTMENIQYQNYLENSNNNRFPFALFPIILQYRATGAGDNQWVDAIDIEGKIISFGGVTKNIYDYYNQSFPISSNQEFSFEGMLEYKNSAIGAFNSNRVNSPINTNNAVSGQCMAVETQAMNNTNQSELATIAQRAVAFGGAATINSGGTNVKAYSSVSDKFGDYRFIVRYPYGSDTADSSIITTPGDWNGTPAQLPSTSFYDASMFSYTIKWGDFYYPAANGETFFEYQFSSVGYNTAQEASNNGQFTGGLSLFAREFLPRYITQLYTNEALTTTWAPSNWSESAGWYAFRLVSNSNSSAQYGTDTASPFPIGGSTINKSGIETNDRIWVAFIENNGIKRKGLAFPSSTVSFGGYTDSEF